MLADSYSLFFLESGSLSFWFCMCVETLCLLLSFLIFNYETFQTRRKEVFHVYPWISHWTHQLLMFHIISFIVFSTCMYENKFQTPCLSTQHLSTKSILLVRCIIHHNHGQENNSDTIFLYIFVFPLIPIIVFRVLLVSIQKAMNNCTMQVTVTFLKLLFLPFPTLTILKYIPLVLQDAYGHDCSDCTAETQCRPTIFGEEQWNRSCACPGLPLMVCTVHYWWWCLIIWLRVCKLDFSVEKYCLNQVWGIRWGSQHLGSRGGRMRSSRPASATITSMRAVWAIRVPIWKKKHFIYHIYIIYIWHYILFYIIVTCWLL